MVFSYANGNNKVLPYIGMTYRTSFMSSETFFQEKGWSAARACVTKLVQEFKVILYTNLSLSPQKQNSEIKTQIEVVSHICLKKTIDYKIDEFKRAT